MRNGPGSWEGEEEDAVMPQVIDDGLKFNLLFRAPVGLEVNSSRRGMTSQAAWH